MKPSITILGMLTAVTSAHKPGRHLHFRANGTEPLTTMTVKATHLHTIVSCAPIVTNCPSHPSDIASLPDSHKITTVVSSVVDLTTTVCPVTSAAQISSSALAAASSTTPTPTVTDANSSSSSTPAPTATDASAASAKPAMTTQVTDVTTDKTYTITMGTGSTASVTTKTMHTTLRKTITIPCSTTSAAAVPESTTTAYSTTKITRTVVISKAKPTTKPTGPSDSNGNIPDSTGNSNCPVATVTVTVTKDPVPAPVSTVYVTVGTPAACTTDQKANSYEPAPSDAPSSSAGSDSTTTPQATTPQATTTPTPIAPYPIGNGTHPTSGGASSTGLAHLRH